MKLVQFQQGKEERAVEVGREEGGKGRARDEKGRTEKANWEGREYRTGGLELSGERIYLSSTITKILHISFYNDRLPVETLAYHSWNRRTRTRKTQYRNTESLRRDAMHLWY